MKLSVWVSGSGKEFKIKSLEEVDEIIINYMNKQKTEHCMFEIKGEAKMKTVLGVRY